MERRNYYSVAEVMAMFGVDEDTARQLTYDRRTTQGRLAGRILNDAVTNADLSQGFQSAVRNVPGPIRQDGSLMYTPDQYEAWHKEEEIDADERSAFDTTSTDEDGYLLRQSIFVNADVPTSSTNYSRPRTVAASFDESRNVMTVVFRDGTFYNYYEVTRSEWDAFRASYSKGSPWLNRGFPNGKQQTDGLFIGKPRGPADVSNVAPEIKAALYRIARTQQIIHRPKAGRTTITSTHSNKTYLNKAQQKKYTKNPNTVGVNPNRNAGKASKKR
jgi:hypothetical protein